MTSDHGVVRLKRVGSGPGAGHGVDPASKGRRDRFIPLVARACQWVRRYLDEVRLHLVVDLLAFLSP